MRIFIAQYRGIGPLSKGIELFTRSDWSHSAIVIKRGCHSFTLYEAWGFKGVVRVDGDNMISVLSANHRPGTPVDIFEVNLPCPNMYFIEAQVGKKYDWSLINKFITRLPATINNRWICSELVGEFCKRSGLAMQNMPTWKMAPEHIGISPVIKPMYKIKTV